MSDLKPCPFCGSTDVDPSGWGSKTSSGPACNACGASAGEVSQDPAANIDAWNRRAPSPAYKALVEAVRGLQARRQICHSGCTEECSETLNRALGRPCVHRAARDALAAAEKEIECA